MTVPAISVVVCCYNAADTVTRTMDSLRAQSFADLEILAIDDGSSDNTIQVLQECAMREPRLRVLENPGNRGTAFTRQRGLEKARAPLVTFVDADDIADPELVTRLHETLTGDPDLLGVGCYTTYFSEEGKDLGIQRVGPESRAEFERLYREAKLLFMVPCTLFRKADALAAAGYRQAVMPNSANIRYEDFSEDLDLWCRMSDLGAEGRYFLTLPESLLRYRKPLDFSRRRTSRTCSSRCAGSRIACAAAAAGSPSAIWPSSSPRGHSGNASPTGGQTGRRAIIRWRAFAMHSAILRGWAGISFWRDCILPN